MTNEELVSQIHESDIFGTFIEIGAGQPVVQALFNISGASKTIYKAESPYSKAQQKEKYPDSEFLRSVSKEFVKKVIACERWLPHADINHNTYYVSSFQIADKSEMLTHGWIGVRYRGIEMYYHITITNWTERERIIKAVGEIGLRILSCKNDMTTLTKLFTAHSAMYSCIDIIENNEGDSLIETSLLNLESGLEKVITISKEGKLIRFEDLSRKGDLILMKGSFNPLHNHHLEMVKHTEKDYPNATPCFSISLDTFDKGIIDPKVVATRIKMINKLGYPVIAFKSGLFSNNVSYLRKKRFYKNLILFPLGSDTVNRLIKSSYNSFLPLNSFLKFKEDFENVCFIYMVRPNFPIMKEVYASAAHFKDIGKDESIYSSTNVRDLFLKGELNEIKKLVPEIICEDILTYLSLTIKTLKTC